MASKQQELEIIESWEQIDETEDLERKLNKLIPPKNNVAVENKSSNKLNGTNVDIILTGDDALRTRYVPPEPTVKILKRPTNNQSHSDTKTFQPKKSLKEREQEYAKARLRILGEAFSQEKEEEKLCIQNKTKQTENESIVRLPRGPDGSKGFTIRR